MHIYYIPKGDLLVVELGDVAESPGARKLAEGVYLDATEAGKVLAVEINNASRFYPREQLRALAGGPAKPKTFTTAQVAQAMGITERAVQAAISRGRLEAEKVGRDWVVTAAAIAAYMADRKDTGPTSPERAAAAAERPARPSPAAARLADKMAQAKGLLEQGAPAKPADRAPRRGIKVAAAATPKPARPAAPAAQAAKKARP